MWIANNWKDYEVIDCSKGEKLERWGKYLLVRPDPQVIWDTPKTEKGWRKMNGHYHRSAKAGGLVRIGDYPEINHLQKIESIRIDCCVCDLRIHAVLLSTNQRPRLFPVREWFRSKKR